jgi:hypothetical protein
MKSNKFMTETTDPFDTPEHYGLIGEVAFGTPRPGETSTGICWKYVLHWGKLELFREVVQNLIDQVRLEASSICRSCSREHGAAKQWVRGPCEQKGHRKLQNGKCADCPALSDWLPGSCEQQNHDKVSSSEVILNTYNGTDFEWSLPLPGLPPLPLARITYDAENRRLVLANKGNLPMEGLLMGGGGKASAHRTADVAGRFGEGLKLSILSALRSQKSFSIRTRGALWHFSFRWDVTFEQYVVYYSHGHHQENLPLDWTYIHIGNIDREEWISNPEENIGIHCFLPLREALGERTLPIKVENAELGTLLLGANVRGCLFVKGIFVSRPFCTNNFPYQFGYNLTEVELDRDRHHVVNQDQMNKLTSQLIAKVFVDRQRLLLQYPAAECIDDLLEGTYRALFQTSWETWYLHSHIPMHHSTAASLLRMWRERENLNDDIMPTHASCHLQPIAEYQLSPDQYVAKEMVWQPHAVFQRAPRPLYESVQDRVHRLAQAERDPEAIHHPDVVLVRNVLSRFHPPVTNDDLICFVRLPYSSCYKIKQGNGSVCIYLSTQILDPAVVSQYEGAGTSVRFKLLSQIGTLCGVTPARLYQLVRELD